MTDRRPPDQSREGASPADFPLGSVESRVAARALLNARKPLEYFVEEDEEGSLLFDPTKRYGRFFMSGPRPMSREEWLREYCGEHRETEDPIEREKRARENEERMARRRARWLERYAHLRDEGLE